MHYRTIIVSDIHLGTKDSQYKKVLHFLQNNTCDNLILNGDIIDWRHLKIFGWWPKEHSSIIAHIINLANEGKTKITYLIGNHDEFWKDIIQLTLNNIQFWTEIFYQSWDKKYLIIHGHQFDKYESTLYGLGTISFIIGTRLYALNRWYNKRRIKHGKRPISIIKGIKQVIKHFMVWGQEQFHQKIEELCKKKHVDGLICGHIHKAEDIMVNKYHYLNSWDRVASCTALVEDENNQRKVFRY